jgi:vitamin B12 transporter
MFACLKALRPGLIAVCCATVWPSFAQILNEVVVTATRTEQLVSEVLTDVTVIDRQAIERSGAVGVADVLSSYPGVQFARNGGAGNTTSLFIRGANTNQTAVYVDGVRIESQSGSGGFTWQTLPLAQIDRIEILRGPAAAIYGSDAIGGVVQVFTRRGEGAFQPYAGVGAGTYNTYQVNAGFTGAQAQWDYAVGATKEKSQGFNVKQGNNSDIDGYDSHSETARLGLQINKDHKLEATLLQSRMDAQYDSSSVEDDHNVETIQTTGLNWTAQWTPGYQSKLLLTRSRYDYITQPGSKYATNTVLRNYVFQNDYSMDIHRFQANLERREDALDNTSTTPAGTERSQNALALGYGLMLEQHSLQLNARHDTDSDFGDKNTAQAAYAYELNDAWQLRASAGSAFRAPTLFQRFYKYGGNAGLEPESSDNIEAGLKYAYQNDSLSLVAYRNRISNLIDYFYATGECNCYENIDHARLQGLTLSVATRYRDVNFSGSYDRLDAKNTDTGKALARRADNSLKLAADTQWQAWQLGGEWQWVDKRFDDKANKTVMPSFQLFNLWGQRQIDKDFSLLLRLNNAFDQSYQLANGYYTAGRNVFVGVQWQPK